MPEIPNVVGHVVGPLIWLTFVGLIAWYSIWGAIVERRERVAARPRRPFATRRRGVHAGEPTS